MFEYRKATSEDLEKIWKKDIEKHPNDDRWVGWRREYIDYNRNGEAITFVALYKNEPIGQVTILLSINCKPVLNKILLCNGVDIANFNAFRVDKEFEGRGHISKLVKIAENYAKKLGINTLTIGVGENEIRNQEIYKHFGFNDLIFEEFDIDENERILYYKKEL